MMGTFVLSEGGFFVLERTSDFEQWDDVLDGTATGTMQLLQWPLGAGKSHEFFRLRVSE